MERRHSERFPWYVLVVHFQLDRQDLLYVPKLLLPVVCLFARCEYVSCMGADTPNGLRMMVLSKYPSNRRRCLVFWFLFFFLYLPPALLPC